MKNLILVACLFLIGCSDNLINNPVKTNLPIAPVIKIEVHNQLDTLVYYAHFADYNHSVKPFIAFNNQSIILNSQIREFKICPLNKETFNTTIYSSSPTSLTCYSVVYEYLSGSPLLTIDVGSEYVYFTLDGFITRITFN